MLAGFRSKMRVFAYACGFLGMHPRFCTWMRVFWVFMRVLGHGYGFSGMDAGSCASIRDFEHGVPGWGFPAMLAGFSAVCGFLDIDAGFWACMPVSWYAC